VRGIPTVTKVSIVSTATDEVNDGAANHDGNPHNNQTLPSALEAAMKHQNKATAYAIADKGYSRQKSAGDSEQRLLGKALTHDYTYQR
jgi:hypothetical protein